MLLRAKEGPAARTQQRGCVGGFKQYATVLRVVSCDDNRCPMQHRRCALKHKSTTTICTAVLREREAQNGTKRMGCSKQVVSIHNHLHPVAEAWAFMLRLQGSLPDNKLDSRQRGSGSSCIILKGPQGPRHVAAHTIKLQRPAAGSTDCFTLTASPDCFNNTKPCTHL